MRVIAIDGPAGAGKSTVSRLVAERSGLEYLDTGAMYRAVAHRVLRSGADPDDADAVGEAAEAVMIVLEGGRLSVDGEDATDAIRGPEVTRLVSRIAAVSRVRTAMREQQRAWITAHGGGVVEGRDIGTVVFPDAILKVFLTADPAVRAARRLDQEGGCETERAEVERSIRERDQIDSSREDSPLRPAVDAVVVDSTHCGVVEVAEHIVELFRERDV